MKILRLLPLLLLFSLPACTEYWWTRGQAPGVPQLLERAEGRLNTAISENVYKRDKLILVAKEISDSLTAAYQSAQSGNDNNSLAKSLEVSSQHMAQLEGKLSPGSRPPFGELAGQLRVFTNAAKSGSKIDASALGLFTARTKVFLASELSVPAPSFGA